MPNTYISKYTGIQIDTAIERSENNESRIIELENNLNDYAKIENIPTKVSQLENDSNYTSEEQVEALFQRLASDSVLRFYCIEDVTIVINGKSTVYPANSNVEVKFLSTDVWEVVPTSDNSILALNA
jgi:hypothetical protein